MGFFRRYKLTDYTVEECRAEYRRIENAFINRQFHFADVPDMLERWACFRELLARHEKKNESPLDEKRQGSN